MNIEQNRQTKAPLNPPKGEKKRSPFGARLLSSGSFTPERSESIAQGNALRTNVEYTPKPCKGAIKLISGFQPDEPGRLPFTGRCPVLLIKRLSAFGGVGRSFGILLCALALLLSCADDTPNAGKDPAEPLPVGEKVIVNFAITDSPYGENEPVTRNYPYPRIDEGAGASAVFVPIEDDMYMYATLKEDESPVKLRVKLPVDAGVKIRVVAYYGTSYTNYAGHADYTATSTVINGTQTVLAADGDPLKVATGYSYRFVAYSMNTTDPLPPFDTTHDITASTDLLWGISPATTVPASSPNNTFSVNITMEHKFARVDFRVQGRSTFTGIVSVFNPVNANQTNARVNGVLARLTVQSGILTTDASASTAFYEAPSGGWSVPLPPGNTVLTSGSFFAFTNNDTTRISISSVHIDNVTYPGPFTAAFTTRLVAGRSYTIELRFMLDDAPPGSWAGSNIYWDGTKLTFDPAGKLDNKGYQGVYFKWGSLVGIGFPRGTAGTYEASGNSNIPLYVPVYYPPTPYASYWIKQPRFYSRWRNHADMIPGFRGISISAPRGLRELNLDRLSTDPQYLSRRGDICKYLGETGAGPRGYRLPAAAEFEPVRRTWWHTGTAYPPLATINDAGTSIIPRGLSEFQGGISPAGGNFFPNSGTRINTTGGPNQYGRYNSSSANSSSTSAFWFRFSNVATTSSTASARSLPSQSRSYAGVVRCIKHGGIIPGIEVGPITVDVEEWDDIPDMDEDLELFD